MTQKKDYVISAQVVTATGLDEESLQASIFSAKNQIAFYASTPSYLPVLKCHGLEDLQVEANKLIREGKWVELTALIDDDLLRTFAVVGSPAEVAQQIASRFAGKVDRISPVIYQPDLALLAELRSQISAVITQ